MMKIGDVLDQMSMRDTIFKQLKLRISLMNLDDVLGPSLKQHCRFCDFDGSTVYFECDDDTWLMEARFMGRKIVEKINGKLGQKLVNKVVFRRCNCD